MLVFSFAICVLTSFHFDILNWITSGIEIDNDSFFISLAITCILSGIQISYERIAWQVQVQMNMDKDHILINSLICCNLDKPLRRFWIKVIWSVVLMFHIWSWLRKLLDLYQTQHHHHYLGHVSPFSHLWILICMGRFIDYRQFRCMLMILQSNFLEFQFLHFLNNLYQYHFDFTTYTKLKMVKKEKRANLNLSISKCGF